MTLLPVLTFHAIHDMRSPVAIDPATFGALMGRLAAAGWRTAPAGDVVGCARGGKPLPPKSLLITFDDGYASVLAHAAPVLRHVGFTAILFVATDLIGRPRIFPGDPICPPEPALTWDEVRKLVASGFEIGSHARSHRDLTSLSDADLDEELLASRRVLGEKLEIPVRFHAYPFGACDERVAAACARAYEGAFTTRLAYARPGDDPRLLPRLDAHYLRFLSERGDLGGAATRAWIALRGAGRAVRSALTRGSGRS